MPSTSLSPNLAPMPVSPRNASGSGNTSARPPLMKRQSSQSSHSSRHQSHPVSPGSVGEHPLPAPRHHVKPRHTKIVLPRNHSSGRNLAKLARQAQQQAGVGGGAGGGEDNRRHSRQRSHEGTAEPPQSQHQSEFRLPGSLGDDDGGPATAHRTAPPMRRNMTAYQLPRNTSHTKLKKNLSHGHLSRLQSGRNLVALATTTHHRAPPSPGLKGRSKRPKSMDITGLEKDLHEREIELAQSKQQQQRQNSNGHIERRDSRKKVGFAVGSAGDVSDDEDVPEMEGSGLQEDEWTDQSASASPYSTRQNTANNSRRASVADKHPLGNAEWPKRGAAGKPHQPREDDDDDDDEDDEEEDADEEGDDEEDEDEDDNDDDENDEEEEDGDSEETESEEPPSPRSSRQAQPKQQQKTPTPTPQPPQSSAIQQEKLAVPSASVEARDHANPTTRRLLSRNQQLPAPALVSNISALDATHTERGSPSVSLQSSRSNLAESTGDPDQDELVSCFVPSTSHPSLGSGMNTTSNTPRQSGFHIPEEDGTLAAARRGDGTTASPPGPASPGSSTLSGSSTGAIAALGRSRTELRMLQEKALADIESTLERHPTIPAHFYDRRNESLKPFLKGNPAGPDARDPNGGGGGGGGGSGSAGGPIMGASVNMGPEIFQGRFRAVNTELRVVQKFRNPLGDALTRLRACKSMHKSSSSGSNSSSGGSGGGSGSSTRTSAVTTTTTGGPGSSQSQHVSPSTGLTTSRSTTSLPSRPAAHGPGGPALVSASDGAANTVTATPPAMTTTFPPPLNPGAAALARGAVGAQSAVQLNRSLPRTGSDRLRPTAAATTAPRREVSFARAATATTTTNTDAGAGAARELSADAIARQLWMQV